MIPHLCIFVGGSHGKMALRIGARLVTNSIERTTKKPFSKRSANTIRRIKKNTPNGGKNGDKITQRNVGRQIVSTGAITWNNVMHIIGNCIRRSQRSLRKHVSDTTIVNKHCQIPSLKAIGNAALITGSIRALCAVISLIPCIKIIGSQFRTK